MAEPNINIPERKTQAKVIKFFKDELHYDYLGNLCEVANKNIRDDDLFAFLVRKQHYSETVARKAIADLQHAAGDLQQGLYSANKTVYSLLKYSHPVSDADGENISVYYIDFENPANNHFAIRKMLYSTEGEAQIVAEYRSKEIGIPLRVYPCPNGCGFHITSNPM